jgi:hypothetical protein
MSNKTRNTVLDAICAELFSLYKKEFPDKYGEISILNQGISYATCETQKILNPKIVLDVKQISSNYCYNTKAFPVKITREGEKLLFCTEYSSSKIKSTKYYSFEYILGFFKLITNKGTLIVYTRREGVGTNSTYSSIVCGDLIVLEQYWDNQKIKFKKDSRLQLGYYKAELTQYGLNLEKQTKLSFSPIFNDEKNNLNNTVTEYFASGTKIIYGKPNNKSVLLYGKQGTGKTSILMYIIGQQNNVKVETCIKKGRPVEVYVDNPTKFIVSVNNQQTYEYVVSLAAKQSIPTIVIWEECDSSLNKMYDNSKIKDFLNGSSTPINTAGCFTFFTTNHPDRIDKTILNRHLRMGKPIQIGCLKSDELKECFEFYFKDIFKTNLGELHHFIEEELDKLNTSWTGGEVEGFSDWFKSYCSNKRIIFPKWQYLLDCFKFYKKEMKEVNDFKLELE